MFFAIDLNQRKLARAREGNPLSIRTYFPKIDWDTYSKTF